MNSRKLLVQGTLMFCAALVAQEPAAVSPGTTAGQAKAPKLVSPEAYSDRRVTFRLYAPNATEVSVQGNWEGGRNLAMTKDASGVWSVTTQPLAPELWAYTFAVNGVRTLDPANYNVARDGVGFMNTFLVLGDRSAVFQPQRVPHGSMTAMWYPSTALKTAKRVFVYTPPGYEAGNQRYPVLYLLHGSGGDEEAWPAMGIANVILDNLINAGRARPMIVVMPNAYWNEIASLDAGGPRTAPPPPVGSGAGSGAYEANINDITGDLIPFVEKQFRTLPGRENRALAGLSMGAGITMNVGFRRLDMFASLGMMSSGAFRGGADSPGGFAVLYRISPDVFNDPESLNRRLNLFYLSCGAEDDRMPSMIKLQDELKARKINFVFRSYPGAHEWRVWRHSLADLAQLLFR